MNDNLKPEYKNQILKAIARKPFYGIDAPYVIISLYAAGIILSLIFMGADYNIRFSLWLLKFSLLTYFDVSIFAQWCMYAFPLFIMPTWMLYSSLSGKYVQRDRLLKKVAWTGTEQVLDVGCGRGLLLIGAAKFLTTGKAYGIDIWSARDLSQNSKQAAEDNARVEGVADKVIVLNQDARNIAFEDDTFDVVMTSLVIHNMSEPREREKALTEMVRVCKPNGIILIQDFQYVDEYATVLGSLGMQAVTVSSRYWYIFPPVTIITCKKPQ